MQALRGFFLGLLLIAACKADTKSEAFASPAATVSSLFAAYGVKNVPEQEIQRRLQANERFDLVDESLFVACFSDWQGDHDQGLGGYVFGRLVAAKDHLRIDIDDGVARVSSEIGDPSLAPVVLVETDDGWKIDLRQSVPSELRQRLYEIYRRARRSERVHR